mmetsp:Transcript_5825/g.19788  ORF Transcript_5825/g.19788 Transcript_5825/m.19788 type:complete len:170 (-) Transcript_5825:1139-1648(-)
MGSKEMDAWKACGAVISSPKFQVPLDAFLDSNCEQFTEDEENKLEYTAIHGQYESLIEEKLRDGLCERLGSAFDWDAFLLQLPAYIEKITGAEVGQGQEAAGHEDDELSANTLGVLYSFIDFAQVGCILLEKRPKTPVKSRLARCPPQPQPSQRALASRMRHERLVALC